MSDILTSLLVVSIFKNVLNDKVISHFIEFLNSLILNGENLNRDLKLYTEFISSLYDASDNQNLYEYLKNLIYTDDNIISRGCSDCIKENEQILNTAKYELETIFNLLTYDYQKITDILENKYSNNSDIIKHLPSFSLQGKQQFDIDDIIKSYSKRGYGIFACYNAFKYTDAKEVIPVKYFEPLTFKELKNYSYQQEVIIRNTLAFLEGKPANNILLYGDRGCGKSSTVKALINEFNEYNLKIIQVTKQNFINLPDLFEKIRNLPLKFIIFADDISFDENEENFSSLKAILEGSLSNIPSNSLIYATTNRMHLVKESFSAREGNEVHYNDTIDEMVSLSDRFGIMLTFSSLNKNEYLDIVKQIAQDCCIEVNDELNKSAMEFSMQKGIMTPRIARQFINDYLTKLD